MSNHAETLTRLVAAAKSKDNEAFLAFFSDDVEYAYHTQAKPIRGLATLRKFIDRYHETLELTAWDIDRWAVNGDKLLVEGYEEYRVKETGQLVGHPYMSILEFDADGRIRNMREYFEMEGKPRAA